MIEYANTSERVLKCYEVINNLRPNISHENILDVFQKMERENYQIIFIEDNNKPVSFAGFRYITHFYAGNIIYIDDLNTLPNHRGKGYAGKLLDHIFEIARAKKLDALHLDSGHQRFEAHRLYLNKGFIIGSHHFVKKVEKL